MARASHIGKRSEWVQHLSERGHRPDWAVVLDNADCLIEYWEPRSPDTQTPHDRDEIYVVVAGDADFEMNGEVRSVLAGDLIFVPAGIPHRFIRCSAGLAMWIAFFGKRKPLPGST